MKKYSLILVIFLFISPQILMQNMYSRDSLIDNEPLVDLFLPSTVEGFLLKTKTRQIWNNASSMWKNDSLLKYTYNDKNLLDTLFRNISNGGNGWQLVGGYTYTYNQNNKLAESYFYYGTFSQSTLRNRYYYSGVNLIQIIRDNWSGGNWYDVGRATYYWNYLNQITSQKNEYRHYWYGFWCYSFKYEYIYNSNNQLSTRIEYDGDCCPAWYLYKQRLYTYDEIGNNIQILGQEWNSSSNIWTNDILYQNNYDENNTLVQTICQDWDLDSADWKNVWRESYTYTQNYLPATILKETWSTENRWVNYTYRTITYDGSGNWIEDITQVWESTVWKNHIRYLAIWDQPVSVINNQKNIKSYDLSQNYPNPFNPTTSIQYAVSSRQFVSLKVYDILGNEIATLVNEEKQPGIYEVKFTVGQSASADSPDISSGIYFYQLKAGNFIETKKMTLLR